MSTVKDLSRLLAEKATLDQSDSNAFVAAFFDIIKDALLKEGIVKVKGLGTFKMMTVKQRESVNVNTGERVIIDSHDRVSFTPDNSMRDAVNKPFSQFETVVLNDGVSFDDIDAGSEEENAAEPNMNVVPVTEQELEQQPVVEPEPVVEEEPEPAVEEEPEPVAEEEPEPAVEEEPEPVVEEEPEPVVEEEPVIVDQEDIIDQEALIEDDVPEGIITRCKMTKLCLVAMVIFGVIIVFSLGFILGRVTHEVNWAHVDMSSQTNANADSQLLYVDTIANDSQRVGRPLTAEEIADSMFIKEIEEKAKAELARVRKAEAEKLAADSIAAQELAAKQLAAKEKAARELAAKQQAEKAAKRTSEQSGKQTASKPAVQSPEAWDYRKYETDPRIRHGAYRIVGIARTIKVKPGETLHSITTRTLGSEMDCYVEALNGKEVKPGQILNLPKLELKKKKK